MNLDLRTDYRTLIAAGAIVVVLTVAGFVIQRTLLTRLARVAKETASAVDDAFVASLKHPLPMWFFLAGLYLATRLLDKSEKLAHALESVLLAILILSVTVWLTELVAGLLQARGHDGEVAAASATGVVRNLVRAVMLTTGVLVLLGTLGISVAPALTTMGVTGLAVALALRETLSNLFAAVQIMVSGNIHVGDFIGIEREVEGYVEDIHWRATHVRTPLNTLVVVPNRHLAESVVTNYHQPSREITILVPLGVAYANDLATVERVTLAVAREVAASVPGCVRDFEPFMRFDALGPSTVDFKVRLRVLEQRDAGLIRHEFIKALLAAYDREGIVVPAPDRVVCSPPERERTGREGGGGSGDDSGGAPRGA
jgi:small-conductance mechanosensitive channel